MILEITNLITKYIPVEIIVIESNNPRSYRNILDKLLATGFKPKKTAEHAVQEKIESYRSGLLKDEDHFYKLKWIQKLEL